ncbi:glycosyltransferase [Flavobacterium sp. XGLA_31]|uniref:glycosyltransferase n=1 Tax=Flavobacterium sp. XGLA_31 TaxID=3447666 RepID=UPI003F4063CD
MKFTIITHVSHCQEQNRFFAYAPYVREMNIWAKYVDEVIIVAPLEDKKKTAIELEYQHGRIDFRPVPEFNLLGISSKIKAIFALPGISWKIYKAMKDADHIHLRCPGNMGLLGSLIQILFPKKKKTAKYAGNWDYKSSQPLSYKLQQWILSNTLLTKNMQVLVYGEWENSTKNIKPFFTASYSEKDKVPVIPKTLGETQSFVFVGTLSNGKQPLYAIQLMEQLLAKGRKVQLTLFGEGSERTILENYIADKNLGSFIHLKGNQDQGTITKAYLENHFVVLPSLSEGWPKVVAEGMFWGCLPIATKVSCVPTMLDNGERGLLLALDIAQDVEQIEKLLEDGALYQRKVVNGVDWSRKYTLDLFESEIKMLLQS